MSCCGKSICIGCIYVMKMSEGKDLCAFCRTPPSYSNEKEIERLRKLMDKGNGDAFCTLSGCYFRGTHGLSQDQQKANELCLRGGDSLAVLRDITTWVIPMIEEGAWKWMRRKLKITMNLLL